MAHHTISSRRTALLVAFLVAAAADLHAQTTSSAAPATAASAPPATTLPAVTITARPPPPASVAGWGDLPLSQVPVQATVVDAAQIRESGARRLSDLARFDASVSEAYDTEGYIDYFTVRGFVIDNRFNFRRDGLPINAETSIPLDNKARVDVLKGLSGMQAGTSAPGGLVDVIVKRPTAAPVSSAFLEWRERGSVLGSVDLSRRFGVDGAFGVRLNAAAEHLDPKLRDAEGHRSLFALAGDWRASRDTLVEAEFERSHRTQPSVPGFSLVGDRVPEVPDPRLNLNNQPWSLPMNFDASTASLRVTQQLGADWKLVAHGVAQRLRTDDRIAFPFGCSATDGSYYADRFCPDGSFDFYDFRSEDERRRSEAVDVALHGKFVTGPLRHTVVGGVLHSRTRIAIGEQIFNYVGPGNIEGTMETEPTTVGGTYGTSRRERQTELHLRDAVTLTERATLWLGARHTRLSRHSEPTPPELVLAGDAEPTDYRQSFTTPFAAASYTIVPGQMVYASWGRGVESAVVPGLPRYVDKGQALPAAKSRQTEIGWKGGIGRLEAGVALFDIVRPRFDDVGDCFAVPPAPADCERRLLGTQRHRGVEAQAGWREGALELTGGVQWLRARVEGTGDATLDGNRPTNVPALTARLQATWGIAALPGLALTGAASYEGKRDVLPDNSIRLPSVTRFDLGGRLERKVAGVDWTLRAGVDNVFDKRAWREAPYQFEHAYLFALAPRTWRLSLQAAL